MPALPHPRAFLFVLSLLFALLFAVCYGASSWLSGFIPWRIYPALPFESTAWPLLPAWSAVYLSLPALLLLAALRLDWTQQWALLAVLCAQLLSACVCFVLLPAETAFPPRHSQGLLALADALNLERNFLPSLHTAFACTAALAARRPLFAVWALLITLSTLLTHEHHLADVLAGMALAYAAWRWVSPWALQPPQLATVRLQWLLCCNQYAFARRHLRYAWISLLIALQSLRHPRRGRLLVSGYVFLQMVDDVMDGDRPSLQPPAQLAEQLMRAWQQGHFDSRDDSQLLAQAFHRQLLQVAYPDTARREVAELLAVMRDDSLRAKQAEVWTAEQINRQHQRTFSLSLNLLLAALGSSLRGDDLPELVSALGWCSTLRDLREDLQAGINNLPAEIWVQLPADEQLSGEPLLRHPAVAAWMHSERRQALEQLAQLSARLAHSEADAAGRRIVNIFAGSVRQFAQRRLYRLYPWLAEMPHSG